MAAGEEAFDLEAKRWADGSWHPCRVSPSSYNGNFDIHLNTESCGMEDIVLTREDVIEHLRFRSKPLQDGDCSHLKQGEKVLAMNNEHSESLYFDAVIEQVHKVRHSGRLPCRCTFLVKWLSPMLNRITTVPFKSIMKLSDENINSHPVISAFLAAMQPPLGSLENNTGEAKLYHILEKQVEEISKLADGSVLSNNVFLANSIEQNEVESKDITRKQNKGRNDVVLVNHFDNTSLLSPLAARAALASLVHEKLSDNICLQETVLGLLPKNEKRNSDQYTLVEARVIQVDAIAMDDNTELPHLVRRSANSRFTCEGHSSVTTSKRKVSKSLSDDSPYSATSLKKSARASKVPRNRNLVSSATASHSEISATIANINHGVTARLTRSAARKKMSELADKGPVAELSSSVNTRLIVSGQQVARKLVYNGPAFVERNDENLAPAQKIESESCAVVSTYKEISSDSKPKKKKRTEESSFGIIEDQGVISKDGETSKAKKKKIPSEKPVLRSLLKDYKSGFNAAVWNTPFAGEQGNQK
ncbi:hypothetical protein ZIOFF_063675 [Zingiber officinale]|uniref:SAWADEE domain-containing protein n=1 Tax=Zingiber officinale TaxID=94328 RepID=A0A8J5F7D9_ZINOF|nr:hypothetical protein ZIOFF_063675 [Zingiber officinale]